MTPDQLFSAILQTYGVPHDTIVYGSRMEDLVYARRFIAFYMRQENYTTVAIGKTINRNHATVSRMLRNHEDELKYNKKYRNFFSLCSQILFNNV